MAKDYYRVETDTVIEVDITPNRSDAISHYGVARDLYAYCFAHGIAAELRRPQLDESIAVICSRRISTASFSLIGVHVYPFVVKRRFYRAYILFSEGRNRIKNKLLRFIVAVLFTALR